MMITGFVRDLVAAGALPIDYSTENGFLPILIKLT
jgi:hypothetical protein